MARKSRRGGVLIAVLILLLLAGYATADAFDVVPGVVTTAPPHPEPRPLPSIGEVQSAPRGIGDRDDDVPLPPGEVLEQVTAELLDDDRIGQDAGVLIADASSGRTLVGVDEDEGRSPASSLKVLVALAALDAWGPDHTLTTRAVAGEDGAVVLVGGGDIMLSRDSESSSGAREAGELPRASLAELAEQVATSLRSAGRQETEVVLDTSMFTGRRYASDWEGIDFDYVMPIEPLAVDGGRLDEGGYEDEPAMAAADAFAEALDEEGIEVSDEITRDSAPSDGEELGAIDSAPLAQLVEHTLATSDNSTSEVLGRLVAVAENEEASFTGAPRAVLEGLTALGLDTESAQLADTSGLLRATEVSPQLFVEALLLAQDPDHSELRSVITSLPIASLRGTLSQRMDGPAAGLLRAKTGTLSTAVSLSGLVQDCRGRLLAFAVLADELPTGGAAEAQEALDSWAADVTTAGCS